MLVFLRIPLWTHPGKPFPKLHQCFLFFISLHSNIRPSMFPPPNVSELHLERCMRVLPHDQNTGGFFIAVLEKIAPLPWLKQSNLLSKPKARTYEDLSTVVLGKSCQFSCSLSKVFFLPYILGVGKSNSPSYHRVQLVIKSEI